LARAAAVRAICGSIISSAAMDPAMPSPTASRPRRGQPPAITTAASSARWTSNGQRSREPPNPVSAVRPTLSSAQPASRPAAGTFRASARPSGASTIANSHGASMKAWAATFHAMAADDDEANTPSCR
jgi:hypothetical protein